MKLAVITIVSGRHQHLRLQLAALARCVRRADLHIVVSMDDPQVAGICGSAATVVPVHCPNQRLPLAAARNAGASQAIARDAEVLVFLDVDCLPDVTLLTRYADVAAQQPAALLSGPVAYLPPPPPGGYVLDDVARSAKPHPGRPVPETDEVIPLDHTLFWSLSFALRASTWSRIGGFYGGYTGYGGEDTDYAELARSRGVPHLNVGAAWAYHQWHPSTDPPLRHLADIVRNGRIFRDRWGWWPMTGWLQAFARMGLLIHDPVSDDWLIIQRSATRPARIRRDDDDQRTAATLRLQ